MQSQLDRSPRDRQLRVALRLQRHAAGHSGGAEVHPHGLPRRHRRRQPQGPRVARPLRPGGTEDADPNRELSAPDVAQLKGCGIILTEYFLMVQRCGFKICLI